MTELIDVKKIGELANLEFSPDELAKFQGQLETIVSYVQKIGEVDVSGIDPTITVATASSHGFREDIPSPPADREVFLKNAPERINHEFKVPRIVE